MRENLVSKFYKLNENRESILLKNIIDILNIAEIPLTVSEILNKLPSGSTNAKVARNSISTRLNEYSDNSNQRDKNKRPVFRVVDSNPLKFWLISRLDELKDNVERDSPETFDKYIQAQAQTKIQRKEFKKNPFGSALSPGDETSALCIIGKSGSGKSTTTEKALEKMKHEYMLYIPIEGEYTFSQYNGQTFERTDFGDFILEAQNNPETCYTVIFDECHRPITVSKLNTDLLQALSSKRNRGSQRFFTMDKVTKKLYTDPSKLDSENPIPLKEERGKILVPDNFGIICLSSRADIICRNEDLINRMNLVVFKENQREVEDLTKLEKLKDKDIDSVRSKLNDDAK